MHKVVNDQTLQNPEARSIRDIFRVCETPMLKLCAKKVNKLYPLTFSAKSSIMGVWQGVPNTRLTNASIISHQKQPSRCVLMKGVQKICGKFTGEHPRQSMIFNKVAKHGCSPVNLLHIFRKPFPKNTSGRLLLSHFFVSEIWLTV